jgi:hypothetical protein
MKAQPKLCEKCKERPSVVGVNETWVCMPCFENALKTARKTFEGLVAAVKT